MQFRHKVRKLVDGQSLASARKRTFRLLRANRCPLETKRVIDTIDPVEFDQIRLRHTVADPGADWPKYLDLDRWIGVNIRRIRQLELDVASPKRILDLGCGAGYFLYIAQLLGHSGVGLDIDRLLMFREITRLLQLRKLRFKVVKPPPVLLDHRRWSSLYERVVLQFCLNGSRFLTNPRGFLVQPLAFQRLVRRGDREKKFAYGRDCYWSANR